MYCDRSSPGCDRSHRAIAHVRLALSTIWAVVAECEASVTQRRHAFLLRWINRGHGSLARMFSVAFVRFDTYSCHAFAVSLPQSVSLNGSRRPRLAAVATPRAATGHPLMPK